MVGDPHFYGDACPGGHGAKMLAGVDLDDQLTAQEANELDAATDRPDDWPPDLPPPPSRAHLAMACALGKALPRAWRRDADGVHHWDVPVLAEYLTAAGWRHESDTLKAAADDYEAGVYGQAGGSPGAMTTMTTAADVVAWLRTRASSTYRPQSDEWRQAIDEMLTRWETDRG
jgi:hypothetical protein